MMPSVSTILHLVCKQKIYIEPIHVLRHGVYASHNYRLLRLGTLMVERRFENTKIHTHTQVEMCDVFLLFYLFSISTYVCIYLSRYDNQGAEEIIVTKRVHTPRVLVHVLIQYIIHITQ